jgi:hypothetical protein
MQSEATLKFWDDFYEKQKQSTEDPTKEWILKPTPDLLEQLVCHLPQRRSHLRVLEIGCGTSSLARELWLSFLQQRNESDDSSQESNIYLLATDVSEVCIHQCQERDASLLRDDTSNSDSGLEYGVLNAAESHPEMQGKFDVIIDKGCLDTFLFRTKQRGSGQKPYGQLIRTVLDNIHSWLRSSSTDNPDDSGVYLILTPRAKLKSARDYLGFSSFERHLLDVTNMSRGDLEGDDDDERIFLYKCRKNTLYSPSCTEAFGIDNRPIADQDTCQTCMLTFVDFRKGEELLGRGEAFWFRQFKGHCSHCT